MKEKETIRERQRDKIERILSWAEYQPRFDTRFVCSLQEALEDYTTLTENQEAALDRIIDRCDVD